VQALLRKSFAVRSRVKGLKLPALLAILGIDKTRKQLALMDVEEKEWLQRDVRAAYIQEMKKSHPDHGGSKEAAQCLGVVYSRIKYLLSPKPLFRPLVPLILNHVDWSKVDWSKTNSQLMALHNRSRTMVYLMRRKFSNEYAPRGKWPGWLIADWSMSNKDLASVLCVSRRQVARYRRKLAPHTLSLRRQLQSSSVKE
jgi:hypothetical protein